MGHQFDRARSGLFPDQRVETLLNRVVPNAKARRRALALTTMGITVLMALGLASPVVAQPTFSDALGSLGSSASDSGVPGPSTPEEPDDGYDEFNVDPISGERSITTEGGITFPQRSISLKDTSAPITATVAGLPDKAIGALLESARNGYVSAPVEYSADPDVVAKGVTITRTYPVSIPQDAVYAILFYDDAAEDWVPVPTEISDDRRTLTAQSDHLSWWTDFVTTGQDLLATAGANVQSFGRQVQDSGSLVVETVSSVWSDGASQITEAARSGYGTVNRWAGTAFEASYKGVFTVIGDYQDAPECTGDVPSWILHPGSATFDRGVFAPVKFCGGHAVGQPSILEVKAALNRTYPMILKTTPENAVVMNSAYPSAENILGLLANPTGGIVDTAMAVADQRIVLPGHTVTVHAEEASVSPGQAIAFELDRSSIIEAAIFFAVHKVIGRQLDLVVGPSASYATIAVMVGTCTSAMANMNLDLISGRSTFGSLIEVVRPVVDCLVTASDPAGDLADKVSFTKPPGWYDGLRQVGKRLRAMAFVGEITSLITEYYVSDNPFFSGTPSNPDHMFALRLNVATDGTPSAESISAGGDNSCAITTNGEAYCWGSNHNGQVGDGTTVPRSEPQKVTNLNYANSISNSGLHTCALLDNGTVKCWGLNDRGQLGDGSFDSSPTPRLVEGIGAVASVSVSGRHSCAALRDGTVRCWGMNFFGQLGDGSTNDSATPVEVEGLSGAVSVATGADHSCALLENGTVRCWGDNDGGELGVSGPHESSTSVKVDDLSGVSSISLGDSYSCALLRVGLVKCWGHNNLGQLGDGEWASRHVPAVVPGLSGVTSLASGASHSCVGLSDGSARCWGENLLGSLGDGTWDSSRTPVRVRNLTNVRHVAAGVAHSCAIDYDGSVNCWGWNWDGSLGDGTTEERLSPVPVLGFNND